VKQLKRTQEQYNCLTLFPNNIKDVTNYGATPQWLLACNFIAIMQQTIHNAEHPGYPEKVSERLSSEYALISMLGVHPSA